MFDVTVIDYGVGNLLSVSSALEHCGAKVKITSDHNQILSSGHTVLPGVGAFAEGMKALKANGLDLVINRLADKGTPILGICLGMQMLFDVSEEFGISSGLGLIPGRVVAIPKLTSTGEVQKIPHVGWNELTDPNQGGSSQSCLLNEISPGGAVYFVHSFMANPLASSHLIAECNYGGTRIPAIVQNNNVYGCQFHPEKSGSLGLKILKNFLLQ
jgi:glutamine amidotransferase